MRLIPGLVVGIWLMTSAYADKNRPWIQKWDTDGDGELSPAEHSQAINRIRQQKAVRRKRFDVNRSRLSHAGELGAFEQAIGVAVPAGRSGESRVSESGGGASTSR